MKTLIRNANAFITFEQFHRFMPEELQAVPLAVWLERSRAVPPRFPFYMKINGQRGVPWLRASDLIHWAKATYGATHPHLIAALIAEFGDPDSKPKAKKRKAHHHA